MTFTQLKYFVETVNQRSIHSAAEACFVSYNAMWKALKSLEAELEIPLLERTASGVFPTSDGKKFYKDAVSILELEDKWLKYAQRTEQDPDDRVLLYSIPIFFNNGTLKSINNELISENIKLETFYFYPAAQQELLLENDLARYDNRIFLCFHQPGSFEPEVIMKKYGKKISYLYSDDCSAYLNESCVSSDQQSITQQELSQLPFVLPFECPIQYSSVDLDILIKSSENIFAMDRTEIFSILSQQKAYTVMRSSLMERIDQQYGGKIKALEINDIESGTDYYALYSPKASEAVLKTVEVLEKYCQANFSTKKYY